MTERTADHGPSFGTLWLWRDHLYMGLGISGPGQWPRYLRPPLLDLARGEVVTTMAFARLENDGTYPLVSGWQYVGQVR